MVGKIISIPSKNVIPGTYECVTSHRKEALTHASMVN